MKKKIKNLIIVGLFALLPFSVFADAKSDAKKLLDKAFVHMDKGKFRTALEFLAQAQLIAEKNRLYDQQFTAKNNIGIIYFNLNDYGEALNYYLEAYTIAIKHLNPKREMTILNNIGTLYSTENDYVKGEEYFRKAYDIAKRENDPVKVGHYALNLARVANKLQKANLGMDYLSEAKPLVASDARLKLECEITEVENLVLRKRAIEAKKLAFLLLPKTEPVSINDDQTDLLLYLSEAYRELKMPDSAIFYIRKALATNSGLEWKGQSFQKLADNYEEKGDLRSALAYKDSMLATQFKLEKAKNSTLFENNKVKFQLQQYKNDLNLNQQRLSLERKLFFATLAIVLLVAFLVYKLYRNKAVKNEQNRIIALREAEIANMALQREKDASQKLERQYHELETETGLRQRELSDEIGQKNRQLSARALYLSDRNKMINDLMEALLSIRMVSDNQSVKEKIRALREHLRTDAEWDNFVNHFEEVNQDFLHELKRRHPDLNTNDIRYISYLYMNLSSKEIGSILNITPEAIRKRRERVSRKIGLAEHASLYDYIATVS